MVWPATKLMLDAAGGTPPDGPTLTKPEPVGSVTVRLRTTAVASVGMPAVPATVRLRVCPAPQGVV